MRIEAWAVVYVVVGLGAAAARAARGRRDPLDLALLVVCWPVYGAFAWGDAPAAPRAGPLAALLPAPGVVEALARRVALAAARVAEMDAVLAQPDLDPAHLAARVGALEAAGHPGAAEAATRTLRTVERLVAVRARAQAELAEAQERLRQLDAQTRIVQVAGPGAADLRGLVDELDVRVDRLDAALEDPYLAPFGPR
ncbi:MAG: hypothetical protein H6704_02125 [Myxococcales bacterium]|nr:hypothetical protein [Myxococcales bacterium]